jgi:beta-glucanase (GH16 family)
MRDTWQKSQQVWKTASKFGLLTVLYGTALTLGTGQGQAQTNVLTNAGLEADADADSWPDGDWKLNDYTVGATLKPMWVSNENHTTGGTHSVKIGGRWTWYSDTSTFSYKKDPNLTKNVTSLVQAGKEYSFGAWMKGTLGETVINSNTTTTFKGGSTFVSLIFSDAGGGSLGSAAAINNISATTSPVTFGWTYISGTAVIPANAAKVILNLGLPVGAGGGSQGTVYVDDVQLKLLDPAPSGPGGGWRLDFKDEFNGTSLDTGFWLDQPWTGRVNNELQKYKPYGDASGALTVAGGNLVITAKRVAGTPGTNWGDYTSGIIQSRPLSGDPRGKLFSFPSGAVEARIKLPVGKGYFPAFWTKAKLLNNLKDAAGNYYAAPELDVMENIGEASAIYHNYHYFDPTQPASSTNTEQAFGGTASATGKVTVSDVSVFHTYTAEWSPTQIKWYVDGVLTKSFTPEWGVWTDNMFLVLNLAIGGGWAGTPLSTTPFPAKMEVDYVRVWEKMP